MSTSRSRADGRASLAVRAVSVIALALGFYALGIALVGFLLWIPWAQMSYGDGIGWSGAACAMAALFFGYAMLPRLPRFRRGKEDLPDPLPNDAHPRLQALVADVAKQVGEKPPDRIYLVPNANAFTGKEGGFLGIGAKSIVGFGLPLLATLSEDEVRAVLAHEFGHHKGGDLRLGPLVHRTRMAMATAIQRLDGSSFFLHWPFLLYGRFFLRVSQRIAREQELAADALAAKVAGADAAARALSRVESLAPRWAVYFHGEVIPLMMGGFQPPLLEGFQAFLGQSPWRADVTRAIDRSERRAPREHDTHPPLAERLEHLGISDPRARERRLRRREGGAVDERSAFAAGKNALGLLDAQDRAEREAIATLLKRDAPQRKDIGWDGIGESAWVPVWRGSCSRIRPVLGTLAIREIPDALEKSEAWWVRFNPGVVSLLSPMGAKRSVAATLGVYLTLACADAGFTIEVPPGGEVVATRDGNRMEPEVMVRQLATGVLGREAFLREMRRLELADRKGYLDKTPPKPAPRVAEEDDDE